MIPILNLLLYLSASAFITIYVGKVLYHHGRHFLLSMLLDEALTDSVNKILLVGYYLVNLGYVCIMLAFNKPATTFIDIITSLGTSIGRIMLTLAVMHYLNITVAVLWNKFKLKL